MTDEQIPLIVPDDDNVVNLKELVARALFADKFRLRNWDSAKLYQKKLVEKQADEAMRRAGLKNMVVRRIENAR